MRAKIECVLDEIDWNIAKGLAGADELGVRNVIVRMCGETRFPDITPQDQQLLDEALAGGHVVVTAVSPGLYKDDYNETGLDVRITEDVTRVASGARRLGASVISLFSWKKPPHAAPPFGDEPSPTCPCVLPDYLRMLGDCIHAEGMTPLLENCYWQWGDSGAATAELIRRSECDHLRLQWDPANSIAARWDWHRATAAGAPFDAMDLLLRELDVVAPLISGVHVRDISLTAAGWKWVPLDEGVIDWSVLLAALEAKGYDGPLTIEHHLPDKIAATRHAFQFLTSHVMQQS